MRPGRIRSALVATLLVLGPPAVAESHSGAGFRAPDARHAGALRETGLPNIVLILADDQRLQTFGVMPNVRHLLADHGITFTNAFIPNPLCCPSRATILTGDYSHTTGVYRNDPPNGGEPAFHRAGDRSTIATWLDPAYRTALIGKYLNAFKGHAHAGYVPPGWDVFTSFAENGGHYYNYDLTVNGRIEHHGSAPGDYSTTVLTQAAVSFVRDTEGPLFLYFAPFGPHGMAIPAPGDAGAYRNLPDWRPPNFDEADVSDKPRWVQRQPRLGPSERAAVDGFRLDQLRTLRSIDRSVGEIVGALRQTGRLHDTLIVFMSDNGIQWGEHRVTGKATAYEESIHVPLVVRFDRLIHDPGTDGHLIVNVDLAPTIAEAAGIEPPATEGASFLPLLSGFSVRWRRGFLLEHLETPHLSPSPSFCGWHTRRYVYVDYASGKDELYDLRRDPYEDDNAIDRPALAEVLDRLRARVRAECDPLPPGW